MKKYQKPKIAAFIAPPGGIEDRGAAGDACAWTRRWRAANLPRRKAEEVAMRLSILDDYQGVALSMADWSPIRSRAVEIAVERHAFADEDAVVRALADSEIVAAMRERTPFQKSVVERLPKMNLLITTGM